MNGGIGKPTFENFPPGTPGRKEQEKKAKMIKQATEALGGKSVPSVEESVKEAEIKKALVQEETVKTSKLKESILKILEKTPFYTSPEQYQDKGYEKIFGKKSEEYKKLVAEKKTVEAKKFIENWGVSVALGNKALIEKYNKLPESEKKKFLEAVGRGERYGAIM